MSSIRFASELDIQRWHKFERIREYLNQKKNEIEKYNEEHQVDLSVVINGRRLTNIGTFRAYCVAYLRSHPKIHQQMTFLIRHLQPTEHGLPLEIYVFSNDQVWANYEAIQADIFDHLLAALPEFDLRVFQNPTGADFKKISR
jgi:miniconductance mechanosensitive channel